MATTGAGGAYGGGGAGATCDSGTTRSGAGGQGLIVITYTPDNIIPQFLTFTYN